MKFEIPFLLIVSFFAASPAFALQALKQCNDVESLPVVQKIDAAEVRINQMQEALKKNTATQYSEQQKPQVCPQLQSQVQSYISATQNLASAINSAAPNLKEIGADSCVSELKEDLGLISQTQNSFRSRVNSICSGGSSSGGGQPASGGGGAR